MNTAKTDIELSIVMPCLNEEKTLAGVIHDANDFLKSNQIKGEIIIADNGSTDASIDIAEGLGVKIVDIREKGYGSALLGGIYASSGKLIIIGDTDGSHNFREVKPIYDRLKEGADVVIGNRFKGGIASGAMSLIKKYVGNPILSGIGRLLFPTEIKDFHCGLRGFTRKAFKKMDIRMKGMEFASEMIVKAQLIGLKMVEVPVKMSASGRERPPHLRTWSDGWRHLRFLLLYSPRWLFFYPGLLLMAIGILIAAILLPGPKFFFDVHTMLYGALFVILGVQSVSFAVLTKTFAAQEKLLPENPYLKKLLDKITLERGLITGGIMILAGLAGSIYALLLLGDGEFNEMGIRWTMRIIIPSIGLLAVGTQIIFSSFFYSILRLKIK